MTQDYYEPSQASFKSPASSWSNEAETFGRFDIGRSFDIANPAFKEQWPTAVLIACAIVPLSILATLSLIVVIGFWAYPVLLAGYQLHGLYLVRRELRFSHLWIGFRNSGRVWLGFILLNLLVTLPVWPGLIFLFAGVGMDLASGNITGDKPGIGMILGMVGFYATIFAAIPWSFYMKGRLSLLLPLIVERKYKPVDALKKSFEKTKQDQWWLMLFFFLLNMIQQAGLALCFVGVFGSMAYGSALYGAALRQLLGEVEAARK